jgi:hypothetical protein
MPGGFFEESTESTVFTKAENPLKADAVNIRAVAKAF